MLSFVDPKRVERKLHTVAQALGAESYFDAVRRLQGVEWEPGFQLDDSPLRQRFLQRVPAGRPHDAAIVPHVQAALGTLAKDERRCVDLLIGRIILVTTPVFASLSNPLGVIICGPGHDWPLEEIAELVLHEAVHQSLFVDDLIHGLFAKPVKDVRIMNPILERSRPFDMAFHGAFVAAVLTDFYRRRRNEARAQEFGASLTQTVRQLKERRELLSAHGHKLLKELAAFVEKAAIDPHVRARDPDARRSYAA